MIFKTMKMAVFPNCDNHLIQFNKECPPKNSISYKPFFWTKQYILNPSIYYLGAACNVTIKLNLSWFLAIYQYMIKNLCWKMNSLLIPRKYIELIYLMESFTIIWYLIVSSHNLITCEDLKDFQKNSKYTSKQNGGKYI